MAHRLADFEYYLPKELIAQKPSHERGEDRLMVVRRQNKTREVVLFEDIHGFLNSGDCLVLNNTKVIKARLKGRKKKTGGQVEIFFLKSKGHNAADTLLRPSKRLPEGTEVVLDKGYEARIIDAKEGIVEFNTTSCEEMLKEIGQVPLPPYIKREPDKVDELRYQTIFAESSGSVASPTAGLHFTERALERIKEKGIYIANITLHIGWGTFRLIDEDDIRTHSLHSEYRKIHKEQARIINSARAKGGKVLAVGTTTARALESCTDQKGSVIPQEGWTDLYIYPPYEFKCVDCLLTNFHMPRSSLFVMVSAFSGLDLIKKHIRRL